jgi:hypothetical protein
MMNLIKKSILLFFIMTFNCYGESLTPHNDQKLKSILSLAKDIKLNANQLTENLIRSNIDSPNSDLLELVNLSLQKQNAFLNLDYLLALKLNQKMEQILFDILNAPSSTTSILILIFSYELDNYNFSQLLNLWDLIFFGPSNQKKSAIENSFLGENTLLSNLVVMNLHPESRENILLLYQQFFRPLFKIHTSSLGDKTVLSIIEKSAQDWNQVFNYVHINIKNLSSEKLPNYFNLKSSLEIISFKWRQIYKEILQIKNVPDNNNGSGSVAETK